MDVGTQQAPLQWRRIYWRHGPQTHTITARGEAQKASPYRYAVGEPPTSGWAHAFVVPGERRSTIVCPYSMTSYSVPNDCHELMCSQEPPEWRPEVMKGIILRNWNDNAK